jgi:hypothetical protein
VDHTSKLNIVYSRHISCKIFFCLNTTSMWIVFFKRISENLYLEL